MALAYKSFLKLINGEKESYSIRKLNEISNNGRFISKLHPYYGSFFQALLTLKAWS